MAALGRKLHAPAGHKRGSRPPGSGLGPPEPTNESGRVSSIRVGPMGLKRPALAAVALGVHQPARSTTACDGAFVYSVIDPSLPMGTIEELAILALLG